jgi:hypothetical protein
MGIEHGFSPEKMDSSALAPCVPQAADHKQATKYIKPRRTWERKINYIHIVIRDIERE